MATGSALISSEISQIAFAKVHADMSLALTTPAQSRGECWQILYNWPVISIFSYPVMTAARGVGAFTKNMKSDVRHIMM